MSITDRAFVERMTTAACDFASPAEVSEAIDRAAALLSNLTHYYHGRSYEDDDISKTATALLMERRRASNG